LVHFNGAYGSVWESELTIKNTASEDKRVGSPADLCVIGCAFGTIHLLAGETRVFSDPFNGSPLALATGLVLRLQPPVNGTADVHFNFRVRDLSRQASTWGTELPVVRGSEFTAAPIELLNLPTGSTFRFTVRVYAIDGPDSLAARARVYDLLSGSVLRDVPLTLQRSSQAAFFPAYFPAYAQLDSLSSDLSNLGTDRIGIEISATDPTQALWAFATVTNNESQHVTTVTPH